MVRSRQTCVDIISCLTASTLLDLLHWRSASPPPDKSVDSSPIGIQSFIFYRFIYG